MFVPVEGLEPNHSKDVLEETDDLWDYFDEKRDAHPGVFCSRDRGANRPSPRRKEKEGPASGAFQLHDSAARADLKQRLPSIANSSATSPHRWRE